MFVLPSSVLKQPMRMNSSVDDVFVSVDRLKGVVVAVAVAVGGGGGHRRARK